MTVARGLDMKTEELERIAGLTAEDLDALPFGAIRLDAEGCVVSYNATEARAAHRSPDRVIGRNFFTEVAPCTDVQEFAGMYRDGVIKKRLQATFPYRFEFEHGRRDVIVTLFYSARTNGGWVFIREEVGSFGSI